MAGTLTLARPGVTILSSKKIELRDLTEPYDPTNNPEGWLYDPPYTLGPNPFIQNILTAIWAITPPSGVQVVIDALTTVPPLYNIGTGVINNPSLMTPLWLGLAATDSFEDGKYEFELQVTGEYSPSDPAYSFNANATTIVYNTKTVECCVMKLWQAAKAEMEDACCSSTTLYDKWAKANLLLQGIINNTTAPCKNYTRADELLAELQDICAGTGTDCGCGC